VAARAPDLLPAIAAGERVAGDALVSADEHVPVDAAPTEAEARCRVVLLPFVANAAQLHPKTARVATKTVGC